MSRAVSFPPLPWASRISPLPAIGAGPLISRSEVAVSEDIFFSEGDVNEIPEQVEQQRVRLLDAVDGPGLDDEAVIAGLGHAPAVATGEADREVAIAARPREAAEHVGR